jgi:hypothetical protein
MDVRDMGWQAGWRAGWLAAGWLLAGCWLLGEGKTFWRIRWGRAASTKPARRRPDGQASAQIEMCLTSQSLRCGAG